MDELELVTIAGAITLLYYEAVLLTKYHLSILLPSCLGDYRIQITHASPCVGNGSLRTLHHYCVCFTTLSEPILSDYF